MFFAWTPVQKNGLNQLGIIIPCLEMETHTQTSGKRRQTHAVPNVVDIYNLWNPLQMVHCERYGLSLACYALSIDCKEQMWHPLSMKQVFFWNIPSATQRLQMEANFSWIGIENKHNS
jgi:hypothetical protein